MVTAPSRKITVDPPVHILLAADNTVAETLEENLLNELRSKSEQGENTTFAFELRDQTGDLVGGLSASTSYGWLLIKVLWVAGPFRRQGHGQALLKAAFDKARAIQCHSVWLDTSDSAAFAFYRAQGFEQFGTLENHAEDHPAEHRRQFLKRRLL